MSARDEVLGRVRAALGDRPSPGPVPRDYLRALDDVDVVELFAERAADYRATVTRVPASSIGAAVAQALRERGARRLVVPAGLPGAWLAGADVEALSDEPPLSLPDLDGADGVISGCAVAVALTGTIVLDAGPGQGRRALTLLPDYHLCVVRTDQIAATVPEALARLEPRRPQTWISGPSATSDIELDRVEGVHGPRTLHILIAG
jgi:L-lactate dehydrogenase complex protein LldG